MSPPAPEPGAVLARPAPARATIVACADEPRERELAGTWLAAHRDALAFVSENEGCGCCVDIWRIEGPGDVVASLPPAIAATGAWVDALPCSARAILGPWAIQLSMALGVFWNGLVVLARGFRSVGPDAEWGMAAGALAGLGGGYVLLRRRRRRGDRTWLVDAFVAYAAGAAVYGSVLLALVTADEAPARTGLADAFVHAWWVSWRSLAAAAALGGVLVPLCFMLRWLSRGFTSRRARNGGSGAGSPGAYGVR